MGFPYFLTALLVAVPTLLHAADHLSRRPSLENSDLVYDRPAASPDAGQPIGNGRMGTMVWTTPGAIELQINRVDVFAVNRDMRRAAHVPEAAPRITVAGWRA